jgi:hypothetical protein
MSETLHRSLLRGNPAVPRGAPRVAIRARLAHPELAWRSGSPSSSARSGPSAGPAERPPAQRRLAASRTASGRPPPRLGPLGDHTSCARPDNPHVGRTPRMACRSALSCKDAYSNVLGSRGRGFKSRRPDGFSNTWSPYWEPSGNDHSWLSRTTTGECGLIVARAASEEFQSASSDTGKGRLL